MARGGIEPTMYECRGANSTEVSYTTTSFIGSPTFHATFRGETAKFPSQPEVKVAETLMGRLVTVEDNRLVPVDGPTIRYTLVIPRIELESAVSKPTVDGILVKTSVANPFFRPNPLEVFEQIDAEPVQCSASLVLF